MSHTHTFKIFNPCLTLTEKTKKQETYQAGKKMMMKSLSFGTSFWVCFQNLKWVPPTRAAIFHHCPVCAICFKFHTCCFFLIDWTCEVSVFFLPTSYCVRLVLLAFGLLSVVAPAFAPRFYPFTHRLLLLLWLSTTPMCRLSRFFPLSSVSLLSSFNVTTGIRCFCLWDFDRSTSLLS
jgi:type II secretory pathway component PulF